MVCSVFNLKLTFGYLLWLFCNSLTIFNTSHREYIKLHKIKYTVLDMFAAFCLNSVESIYTRITREVSIIHCMSSSKTIFCSLIWCFIYGIVDSAIKQVAQCYWLLVSAWPGSPATQTTKTGVFPRHSSPDRRYEILLAALNITEVITLFSLNALDNKFSNFITSRKLHPIGDQTD